MRQAGTGLESEVRWITIDLDETGISALAGGRPKVEEIMAYLPALIPMSLVETKVDIVEA